MVPRALCAVLLAILLLGSVGCSVSATKSVDVITTPGQSLLEPPGGGGDGYVYVPVGGVASARQAGAPWALFPSPAAALAAHPDWVPAQGVEVRVGAESTAVRGGIESWTTGSDGRWFLTFGADTATVVCDFSEATSPGWASTLGTVTYDGVDCTGYVSWSADVLVKAKSLASVPGADLIDDVRSFGGSGSVTNLNGVSGSVSVWLSNRNDLGFGDLFDFADPQSPQPVGPEGAPAAYFLKTFPVAATSAPQPVEITWQEIADLYQGDARSELLRVPNPKHHETLALWFASVPSGMDIRISSFSMWLELAAGVLSEEAPARNLEWRFVD